MAASPEDVLVQGKADLGVSAPGRLAVSGITGEGVGDLVEAIGSRLAGRVAGNTLALTDRQARALRVAAASLEQASAVIRSGDDGPEIVSALVREAVRAMDEMVGRVGVEDILGEIFSQFCIGK
jgi:tRNA modification GTPase